ncbi:MAG: methionyl-tRNA formyltransferase [Candidatus Eutrophobiaceae bacterium]
MLMPNVSEHGFSARQVNDSKRLVLAFAGTPELAAWLLQGLVATHGHDVAVAITQPDRPAGRRRHLRASAVKRFAAESGILVQQPPVAADIDVRLLTDCDLLVVAAYGLRLPLPVLRAPRFGCINVHFSLLPRWRGANPIRCAIRAGDTKSGACIFRMEEGLDTGSIYARDTCAISATETYMSLKEKLMSISAHLLQQTLAAFASEQIPQPAEQNHSEATYAAKFLPRELWIDWRTSALLINRQIRALNSEPLARASLGGKLIKIIDARPINIAEGPHRHGEIINWNERGLQIACGEGSLDVQRLQMEGGKPMDSGAFFRGHIAWLQNIVTFDLPEIS